MQPPFYQDCSLYLDKCQQSNLYKRGISVRYQFVEQVYCKLISWTNTFASTLSIKPAKTQPKFNLNYCTYSNSKTKSVQKHSQHLLHACLYIIIVLYRNKSIIDLRINMKLHSIRKITNFILEKTTCTYNSNYLSIRKR